MWVIAPGKGWCSAALLTNLDEEWIVLGPLAAGDYVRHLDISMTALAAQRGLVGAVLGPSGEASPEAYRTGGSLIQRSVAASYGHPHTAFDVAAGVQWRLRIPVGVRGETGSRYVIVYVMSVNEPGTLWVTVGAEVLRFEKGEKA